MDNSFQPNSVSNSNEGNGAYSSIANSRDFLMSKAKEDVRSLHRCISRPMFDCLSLMIRKAWETEGEVALAKTFFDSYVNAPKYNVWNCSAAGIFCCSPSNNCNERSTLSIKGSKTEEGYCHTGKNLGNMLKFEWPEMIYRLSMRFAGVSRHIAVDEKEVVMNSTSVRYKALLEYTCDVNPTKDLFQPPNTADITFMNTRDFLGTYITTERINMYEDALKGVSSVGITNRRQFVDAVESLCKVTRIKDSNDNYRFRGNCVEFWKVGYCDHSAYCQYKDELLMRSLPIYSTRTQKKKNRLSTHLEHHSRTK